MAVDPLLIFSIVFLLIIGFVVFYYRDLVFQSVGFGKPRKTITEQEIEQRLVQIRYLAREQKFREGVMLMWQTFVIASEGFVGMIRSPTQTAREMAMAMMARGTIDAGAVNAIVTVFEKARYSTVPISVEEFNQGLNGLHRFLQVVTSLPGPGEGTPEGQPS